MNKIGMLKTLPASWTDVFFANVTTNDVAKAEVEPAAEASREKWAWPALPASSRVGEMSYKAPDCEGWSEHGESFEARG